MCCKLIRTQDCAPSDDDAIGKYLLRASINNGEYKMQTCYTGYDTSPYITLKMNVIQPPYITFFCRGSCVWYSWEFDHQVAVCSFSTWFLMSKHDIVHQISDRLKVLCSISYMIIMHIWLINNILSFYQVKTHTIIW